MKDKQQKRDKRTGSDMSYFSFDRLHWLDR